jgi:hypothetical protein
MNNIITRSIILFIIFFIASIELSMWQYVTICLMVMTYGEMREACGQAKRDV